MAYDEEKKKKKKGKFSFLKSLSSLGSGKSTKTNGKQFEGQAGSYLENKKNKIRKLEEVFEK